ncbi:MAG TPA: hypothetical protein VFQ43_02575, partial [Nitrososphaera sp.]|nr:hypothetical protein [Nitrososphaera sp.]
LARHSWDAILLAKPVKATSTRIALNALRFIPRYPIFNLGPVETWPKFCTLGGNRPKISGV